MTTAPPAAPGAAPAPGAAQPAPAGPADGADVVLRIDDLRIATTGDAEILHGISLSLRRGQLLGLVGESGSGKTTAGLACLGHFRAGLKHTGGSVTIWPRGGERIVVQELGEDALRQLRGARVAYIPQDPALSLNPAMRVGEQIREVLDVHRWGDSDAAREARVAEVLADVGLPSDRDYRRRWPHQLSGGQQQRIGIAMAFAMFPDVLILDEPTTGLDVSTQAHVLDTIRDMTRRNDVAGLYITHDLAVVAELADRVAVMLRGMLVEEGPVERVLHHPEHDYTKRLLEAVPDLAGRKAIGGDPYRDSPARIADDATAPPLLAARNIRLSYGEAQILDGIDLTLEPGECTMLLGESGSGKTTLSRCVAGLIDDYTGTVALESAQLAPSTRKRTAEQRSAIQYVFQSPFSSLNPRRTIGESLTVPLETSQRVPKARRRRVVEEALDAVRLGRSFFDRRPGDLSGGERQRAAIARALVNSPRVLVCDEVTSALDVSVQASIIGLLRRLREENGLAMLFVTHNITLARHIADNLAILNRGRIVDYGPVDDVFAHPTHAYTKALLADIPTL
ncbi:ATP-binding cassette domain-containing protein [Brevibacterium sp. 5221]|uniref:ATP-binding cassette domain-containing protein n=1 Tax=Brevibacterium rongguiense TaxID=2695267 RepID=A0A6N9H5F6_9MICO|nr:ABC transporter ATP-binding protein [Brevibacterium rongguiense]MYM19297.1 ATP-binding cassette domain-containing protein [Brevibacterium rongguiense]